MYPPNPIHPMRKIKQQDILLDKRSRSAYMVLQVYESENYQVVTEVSNFKTGQEEKVHWTGPELNLTFRIFKYTSLTRMYVAAHLGETNLGGYKWK